MNNGGVFGKNRNLYVSVASMIVDGLLEGSNFVLIYLVIEEVFSGDFDLVAIMSLTVILVAVFLARIIIYGWGYVRGQIGGAQVSRNIRVFLGEKIKRIPLSSFSDRTSGDYLNALTVNVNDYEQILTHKTGNIAKNIMLGTALTCFTTWLYAPAGAIVASMFALLVPGLWYSWRQVKKYGTHKSAVQASNTSKVVEHIAGMQTLRAYGVGGMKNDGIVSSMREYSDVSYRYEVAVTPPGAVIFALIGCGLPALIMVCGNAWLAGEIEVVSMLLIIMLPLFIVKLSTGVFIDLTAYKNLMISKRRIQTVVDEQEETGSTDSFPVCSYSIRLEKVFFSYDEGRPLFQGLNLICEPGKLTALVGDSGCGKSTVLSLIARYYRPDSGRVVIGNTDIATYAPESIMASMSIVDQEVFLFDDAVMDNIRYARPDATDDEVVEACRLANADAFVCAMPHGYASRIGENGDKLSGGERQRLSIARAILRDSPIVLLDEATASLDIENELAVKEAITNLLAHRKTVVMVAHTLPIVRGADSIAVIGEGRVLEQGTHDELVLGNGKYARMWSANRELV